MKEFEVNLSLTFSGWCKVKAKTQEEAEQIARQNMTGCRPTVEDNGCDKITDWGLYDLTADVETV